MSESLKKEAKQFVNQISVLLTVNIEVYGYEMLFNKNSYKVITASFQLQFSNV